MDGLGQVWYFPVARGANMLFWPSNLHINKLHRILPMKYIGLISLISSCVTLNVLGNTSAFEKAVSAYCTKGKTPALAQQVVTTMQGWKQKDQSAANTFLKGYGCVQKSLETFLTELRAQIRQAAIPVAPAVPVLPAPHYERPIPTAPAVPEFREGELVPEVPTLTPEEEQATATSAAEKEAAYLIGELKKATSYQAIDNLERQAAGIRNLSSTWQRALNQAIQAARNRLAKEEREYGLAQLRTQGFRVIDELSRLLKTPWNIELPDQQWETLVSDLRKQLATANELAQTLEENNFTDVANAIRDHRQRLLQRLNDTLKDRKAWFAKKEEEQQTLQLEKQAQELLQTLSKQADEKLIDQASKLLAQKGLRDATAKALSKVIRDAHESEVELGKQVTAFAQALTDLRLEVSESKLKEHLKSILTYLNNDELIHWNTLSKQDAQRALDKLTQAMVSFKSSFAPQREQLLRRGQTEQFFAFAMDRTIDEIDKALRERAADINKRQKT